MKNIKVRVVLIFSLLFFHILLLSQDVIKVKSKIIYDGGKIPYKVETNEFCEDCYTISRLDTKTLKNNGISIEYIPIEGKDTIKYIRFFVSGKQAHLTFSLNAKTGNLANSVSEYNQIESIDTWRGDFYEIRTSNLDEYITLYYLRSHDTIFWENYIDGYRKDRIIYDRNIFDSIMSLTQAPGAKIFFGNCTSCHSLYKEATGPSLKNVLNRHSERWVRKWIRNSPKMIADGDREAIEVYEKWNKTSMVCFPNFTEKEMGDLITYLRSIK
jgi:cytochrome c2